MNLNAYYDPDGIFRAPHDVVHALEARLTKQAETIRWYRERFGDTGQGAGSTDCAFRNALEAVR